MFDILPILVYNFLRWQLKRPAEAGNLFNKGELNMSKLDHASCYRSTAITEMPNGKLYIGPVWMIDGELFVLYGNDLYAVEKGVHWKNWKVKR